MSRLRAGWMEEKIGDIAKFSQGKQVGLKDQERAPQEGYVRFVRIVDYTQNTDDIRYIKDPGERYHVFEDDIIMVRYGTPGLIGRGIAGVIANNLFKISIEVDHISKDYLALFLMQKSIQDFLSSRGAVAMPALNFGHLKDLPVYFPSLIEQKHIVDQLVVLQNKTQSLEKIYQQQLSALLELKQSIFNKVFKGELSIDLN